MIGKSRRFWLFGLGLPAIVVALVIAAWIFAGPLLKGIVASRASAAIGRTVTIGSLHVHPGRITTVTADNVTIAEPPNWPQPNPPFAQIAQLTVRFDVWTWLWHRRTVIPSIDISQPRVFVAELPNHDANYRLNLASSSGSSTTQIGELRIDDGQVRALLAPLRANVAVALRTEQPPGRPASLIAEARGTYAAQPIQGRLVGGAILGLRDTNTPWPIDLMIANGPTQVRLQGTISDPMALAGANLRLNLAGPSLARLTPLTGIALPETPAYRLAGALDFANHRVRFTDIRGQVGSSDLEGTIAVSPDEPRPVMTADLQSRAVDLVDLGGFIGAKPSHTETKQEAAAPGLFPTAPISIPKFSYADVHLRYRAGAIRGRSMPLDNVAVALDIVNGHILLHPLDFGVGSGRIESTIKLDPAGNAVRTEAEVNFQSVAVSELMKATGTFGGAGSISGSARISTEGNSVASMAANGNGEIILGMAGGDLSALLVDLSGLEFGDALLSALGIPKRTQVECLIADFGLQHGILQSRALIMDTGEAIVNTSGGINLQTEAMRFQIRTAPKHITIGTLHGPINVSGTLKHPSILPGAETVARAGLAGALAAIFPPLAVLPTIQFGTQDQHRCEALLAQAREQAPGTKPPAPERPSHR